MLLQHQEYFRVAGAAVPTASDATSRAPPSEQSRNRHFTGRWWSGQWTGFQPPVAVGSWHAVISGLPTSTQHSMAGICGICELRIVEGPLR